MFFDKISALSLKVISYFFAILGDFRVDTDGIEVASWSKVKAVPTLGGLPRPLLTCSG